MKKGIFILFISIFFTGIIFSQQKTYFTKKIEGQKLKIDGHISEEVWNNVEWSGDFVQYEPVEGAAPSQKTEFKIIYDENNIYVAFKMYDNEPDKIEKRLSRRDSWDGDLVVIQFDSYFDKKTAFMFGVNVAGVRNDAVITNDDINNDDDTWDPLWSAKTSLTEYGWSAEIKIPLSQLRFSNKKDQTWGIELGRYIFRNNEWSVWQAMSKEKSGWVSRFGELRGLKNLKPKRQVEIAPYISTSLSIYEAETDNPFADGKDLTFNAGFDGKIGITNDLTLDFAVNPDFGQVEADPSQVNLTAFETFFAEKRPFFIEGSNITDYTVTPGFGPWSRDNLFYSRRLGRNPHYYPDTEDDEYLKMPNNTRIISALKLTGKTKKGISIGIIESLSNKEFAKINVNGNTRREVVEPYTNYFAGRIQKDMNEGNTIFGAIVTSTNRFINSENFIDLNNSAYTGGIDFQQFFSDKKYYISGKFIGSYISGSETSIYDLQESSVRFFQRPDADYLSVDTTLTSLIGHGGDLSFGKNASKGFNFRFNLNWRSPGLELNDMGFIHRANMIFSTIDLSYNITEPFWIFRNLNFGVGQFSGWDFGGTNLFIGGSFNTYMQFKNLWSQGFRIFIESDNIDNFMLRGGPAFRTAGNININYNIHSNPTKKLTYAAGISLARYRDNSGDRTGFFGNISYRPVNFLSVSLSPHYNSGYSSYQYVETVTDNTQDKYIFADIHQKTFSFTARIEVTISPDFTIQYYGAPFISAVSYTNLKKVTNPTTKNLDDRFHTFNTNEIQHFPLDEMYGVSEEANGLYNYYFDYPDFNYQQFRSNLVLRWEYKPGSLLYLVWSQDKTEAVSDGTFNLENDIKSMFKIKANDIFLIKFSYRFIL